MTIPGDENPFGGRPPPSRDMGADLGAAEPAPVTDAMITPHTSSRPSPTGAGENGFVCHVCQAVNPARASYCLQCGVRHHLPDRASPPASAVPPPHPAPPDHPRGAGEPTGEWSAAEWDLDFSEYDRPLDGGDPAGGEWEGEGPLPVMPGEESVRPPPAYSPFVWRRAVILFVIGAAVILAALTLFRSGDEPEPAPSTTTLPAAQESAINDYVIGLQALAGEVAALGSSAAQVNRAWDDRTQNFDVTRSGLISIRLQAEDLPEQLAELDPPAALTLDNRLRLQDSLQVMADSAGGMVAGLESPDTGEARSRALDRFQAAVSEFDWVSEEVISALRESTSSPPAADAP